MSKTIYQYATKGWPVVKGCDMALPCAARCWAARQCHRLADNPNLKVAAFHQGLTDNRGRWTGLVKLNKDHLLDPLSWRNPDTVAVAYHGDLFLAEDDAIAQVFAMMAACYWHTFLVLTKRAKEMLAWMPKQLPAAADRLENHAEKFLGEYAALVNWPLPNVRLGVSITDQKDADERIPPLLKAPAVSRWVSLEPLLGAVNLRCIPEGEMECTDSLTGELFCDGRNEPAEGPKLDWVVLGGESGPGARPLHPDWVRSVRDQCVASGVPFFFKQWGEYCEWDQLTDDAAREIDAAGDGHYSDSRPIGKKLAGRRLDGREWTERSR